MDHVVTVKDMLIVCGAVLLLVGGGYLTLTWLGNLFIDMWKH